jgi:hypothetical protein
MWPGVEPSPLLAQQSPDATSPDKPNLGAGCARLQQMRHVGLQSMATSSLVLSITTNALFQLLLTAPPTFLIDVHCAERNSADLLWAAGRQDPSECVLRWCSWGPQGRHAGRPASSSCCTQGETLLPRLPSMMKHPPSSSPWLLSRASYMSALAHYPGPLPLR